MAALASDWLRHFRLLLWNHWMEFNETWQEARSHCPLPSCVFLAVDQKVNMVAWSLIGLDIFNFFSKTAERNSTKLERNQDLNIFYHIWVFGANLKNKMATSVSYWLRHFHILLWNHWMEFIKTLQEPRS